MAGKKADNIIRKLEKGPLQRFKNQNLLLKKFGEVGLKVYRAITGRRTTEELKKDLALEDSMFYPVIDYMQETGMIELVPKSAKEIERAPIEKPIEEAPPPPAKKPKEKAKKGKKVEEEAPPPEEVEEEKPKEEEEAPPEEEKEEEIEPIRPEGIEFEEKKAEEEKEEEEEEKAPPEEEKEEKAEEEAPPEEEKEEAGFEIEEKPEGGEELSSVEKIIKDKYGDVGLQVYTLIDGEKTAEEIMKEVGISESKLIEILDFMDKQGIIKLEYPGEKRAPAPAPRAAEEAPAGFAPMLEAEKEGEAKEVTVPNPVEVPTIISADIIKSVQMSAKVLLTYKDEGKRIHGEIDGKKDVVDIALKVGVPLYRVYEVLNFLMDNAMLVLKPMQRDYIRKKYGDDGFTIYKKYGREGLMLYELIGKDLTFRQMAEMVTKDKEKAVEMFLFIHEVLGIELPIDRDVLARQLSS